MHPYEIKKIATRNEPFIIGYEDFVQINDNSILGNGILIDKDGEEIWNVSWKHGYFSVIYLKEQNVIITDRVAMIGPTTGCHGICCIRMETGEYIWKHWYDNELDERIALRKRQPDINLVSGIGIVYSNGEYLYIDGFKVRIDDGSYEYIGDVDFRELSNLYNNVTISKKIKSYNNYFNDSYISLGIHEAIINNKTIKKEQYFFHKTNLVVQSEADIYFFGVPWKKNPKRTILFKYSLGTHCVKEIELPFRGVPEGVYDFFDKGMMIYENSMEKRNTYNLWLIG